MNTDILVDQVVDNMARSLREKHILREMLRSLVRLAKAEQSLQERRPLRVAPITPDAIADPVLMRSAQEVVH